MKQIAFMVSGGDAPGINACIAGISQAVHNNKVGCKVIYGGLDGLIDCDVSDEIPFYQGMSSWAGSVVPSGRSERFRKPEWQQKAFQSARNMDIDGLIVMGGEGSTQAAYILTRLGLPCICIPVTIDNDVWGTDYTIGFDTGVQKVHSMVTDIIQTGRAYPGRTFFIETLGGPTGHLALAGGLAGGASVILLPELRTAPVEVAQYIKELYKQNPDSIVIVGGEGLSTDYEPGNQGVSFEYNDVIQEITGVRSRISLIGYAMRGSVPSSFDANLGQLMGYRAVELLLAAYEDKIILFRNNQIEHTNISKVVGKRKPLNNDQLELAKKLGCIVGK